MTAARGLVHSERPEKHEGLMWGFQLWLNLPGAEKMSPPAYRDLPATATPVVRSGDASVRVIAGRLGDTVGPLEGKTTNPLFLDVEMDENGTLTVPVPGGHAAFVYAYDGPIGIGRDDGLQRAAEGSIALLGDGEFVTLTSTRQARALLIAGRPIREPIARHGPFVMNTQAEIAQAFKDFENGEF